jgi:hypothetical protein
MGVRLKRFTWCTPYTSAETVTAPSQQVLLQEELPKKKKIITFLAWMTFCDHDQHGST